MNREHFSNEETSTTRKQTAEYPMNSHQLVNGAANLHPYAFSWNIHLSEELLAIACGNTVVIYHGSRVIQALTGHDSEVTLIEWCKPYSKVCGLNQQLFFLNSLFIVFF